MKEKNNYEATIKRVGFTTIIWNILLAVGKLIVGIIGKSQSMISDAIHSGSDVFTTIIVMIGAKIAGKQSDEEHPYGHERFESICSIFLGVLLAITAIGIGYSGVKQLINFKPGEFEASSLVYLALIGAIVSIVVKGIMFIYTIRAAKRIGSTSLKADAWHHLSDSLSSIGSLLGIIGLMIGHGWEILDPIAAVIICLVIIKVSFDIVKGAVDQLVDKCVDKEEVEDMKKTVKEVEGVIDITSFYTRQFGNKSYLDVEVVVDNTLSLEDANKISIAVHDALEHKYENIKHCFICVRPNEESHD